MSEHYEQPLAITYGYSCPYHGYHQRQILLAYPPKPKTVIVSNQCAGLPNEPVLTTKLYANLTLKNNIVTPNASLRDKAK